MALILCGHDYGEWNRTDTYEGHTFHTMLADYQDDPNGGNGWLRRLQFRPSENMVQVRTYSPYPDEYQTDEYSEFTLPVDLRPAFEGYRGGDGCDIRIRRDHSLAKP